MKASRRGHVEEGIGGWNDGRDSRVVPAWTDRDTAHVRPASHTQLNRPAPKAWISRTTLVVSMAEAWDVAGAQPLFASYSPCGCVKCRMQRRDKGAYGSTAGTSKGHPDGDGVIVASDSRSGTSGAMVRIDAWDGGGGTQFGPVRWMDGGPSPAIPAASTHLHWAEPQCLTAARTSKHMGLVGTGTASGLLGLNPIVCSDSSARASAAECNLRGNPRDTCLKASRRGHVEEGIGGWNVGWDSRVVPAWTDRDTTHVRPASHTQLNRPAPTAWISRTSLVVSMAEAWDVAGAQPLFASYSPCGCVKCRMQRRDKGAYGSTAGTSKGHPDGDGVIVASDSRSGTSGAMVRIDAWDGGGGTQFGPVRWMDGGPSPAIPAASTHLHWAEPQYLTAARTSKHMGSVGTDGAVTEGAVTWTTAGSTSQRGAEAALDRLRTAVSHGRKL